MVATGRTLKAPGLFSLAFDNLEGGRLATRNLTDFETTGLDHRNHEIIEIGIVTPTP